MSIADLMTWPYILVTVIVAIILFYIARSPAHSAILSFSRIIYNAMRLTARSVLQAEKRLERRNKEVLLAAGKESIEKEIEREFHMSVGGGYPAVTED